MRVRPSPPSLPPSLLKEEREKKEGKLSFSSGINNFTSIPFTPPLVRVRTGKLTSRSAIYVCMLFDFGEWLQHMGGGWEINSTAFISPHPFVRVGAWEVN